MATIQVYRSIEELKNDRKKRKLTKSEIVRQKKAALSIKKIVKKSNSISI